MYIALTKIVCVCCRDCVFDLCAEQRNSTLRCETYAVYALACQEQGITLGPWRTQLDCGISYTLRGKHTLTHTQSIKCLGT